MPWHCGCPELWSIVNLKKLLSLESRIEILEQDMISEPRDEMLAELIGYKTQLRKFR